MAEPIFVLIIFTQENEELSVYINFVKAKDVKEGSQTYQ